MSTELLLDREIDGHHVAIRQADAYVNATALCKACGKLWADYARLGSTQEFFAELSGSMGIPIDRLVVSIVTGPNASRGTWVHPDVAVNLAQWCSPRFAVAVSRWVRELLTTGKVEIPINTGDSLLDFLEQTRRAAEQTAQAIAAIAETRKRQLELEHQQAATHRLAQSAQRTATAALCQAESNHGYFTVLGYCRLLGREITVAESQTHGRALSGICRSRGIEVGHVTDPRFGRVNTYPESVLADYFRDDAGELLPLD